MGLIEINGMSVIGQRLTDFIRDHAEWSQKTFGTDADRGPVGGLKHLIKEADEAIAAFKEGRYEEFDTEVGDCFILLMDVMRRGGMTINQLLLTVEQKMEVNKNRKWSKPAGDDEPIEHDRSGDGP